jgi:PadR family transcriptional regulator PadR
MAGGEVHGLFQQAVLIVIASLDEDSSGAAIVAEIRRRLRRNINSGAVHATLQRLERKHLAVSRSDPAGGHHPGRPRRLYSITRAGQRALRRANMMLHRVWDDYASNDR